MLHFPLQQNLRIWTKRGRKKALEEQRGRRERRVKCQRVQLLSSSLPEALPKIANGEAAFALLGRVVFLLQP